jgi:hypothetical protein
MPNRLPRVLSPGTARAGGECLAHPGQGWLTPSPVIPANLIGRYPPGKTGPTGLGRFALPVTLSFL